MVEQLKAPLTSASPALVRPRREAQAATVLDHSCTLPQGDVGAGPMFAGCAERSERDLIVLDAGDVLNDAFAVRGPRLDAESEWRMESPGEGMTPNSPSVLPSMMVLGPACPRTTDGHREGGAVLPDRAEPKCRCEDLNSELLLGGRTWHLRGTSLL